MNSKFLFLPIAIFAISCSSDSNDVNDNVNYTPILVTKYVSDGETHVCSYNGTKITEDKNITIGNKETFTYTGDLITKITHVDNTGSVDYTNFTYDGSGRLTSVVENDSSTENWTITYNYLSSNHVTITEKFTNTATNYKKTYIMDTYLNADNSINYGTISMNVMNGTTLVESGNGSLQSIVYDTKNNPFKNVTGYTKLMDFLEDSNGSFHNILSYKKIINSGTGTESNIFTNSCQYNSASFPTQITCTSYFPNNTVSDVIGITYEYNHN